MMPNVHSASFLVISQKANPHAVAKKLRINANFHLAFLQSCHFLRTCTIFDALIFFDVS